MIWYDSNFFVVPKSLPWPLYLDLMCDTEYFGILAVLWHTQIHESAYSHTCHTGSTVCGVFTARCAIKVSICSPVAAAGIVVAIVPIMTHTARRWTAVRMMSFLAFILQSLAAARFLGTLPRYDLDSWNSVPVAGWNCDLANGQYQRHCYFDTCYQLQVNGSFRNK